MGAFVEITNGLATQWIGAMWPIIWQSAVLAGVVYLLTLCLRRLSAAVRFWLWMLVPLRLLVMPLITISLPLLPAQTQLETANIEPVSAEMVIAEPAVVRGIETARVAEEFEPMSAAMEKADVVSTRIWPNVWALLMGGWLAGIAFWCVRLIRGWRRIRQIAGSATEVSESQVLALAQKAATMLGLRRVPRILVTGESVSPFLFGVLRPVLVIPAGFVAEVRGEALFAVFAHEFAHLWRRDPLVGWVLAICEVIYFFHPVFYFVKRRILFERERACDDWVVATSKAQRSIYANALISAADICRGFSTKIGPVGAVAESFGNLKKRLIAIGSNLEPKARLSISALILLVIIGAICVPGIVLTARSTTKAEDKTAEAAKNVASGQAIDPVISESGELRPTIEGETRILHFPRDRSMGKLFVKDMSIKRRIDTFHHWIDNANWEYFGQAMGDVRVPANKQLRLLIYSGFLNAWKDLSPLSKLKPDDLYRLSIHGPYTGGLRPGNRCMPHLAGLTGLRVLDLRNTNISSEGIKFIKGMKSLERLTLPDQITDDSLADVAELQSLKGLYFKKNRITNAGLRHLAKLSSLEELELGGERIGDAGLAHVAKLPSLRYLLLWGNFSDAGLAHLKNVTSLRILHINIRQFSDVGLAHLSDLAELENLSLHYMENITDQSIIHLKKMRSLKKLDIASSQVTDRGLEYLAQIKTLEHLDLPQRDQRITDIGLAHLGQLPNLKHLAVSEMHYAFPNMNKEWYTDKGLAELAKCQLLEDLSIGSIGITDAGIEHIAKLTNLKKLHLFGCVNVTDAGLAKLTSLKSLRDLDISRANTTISGVNQLDSLTNLNRLSVRGLKWGGAVLDISGLTNLENVSLWFSSEAGDAFTDADLVCLADLKRLKWLQIGPRHFTDRGMAYLVGLSNMERLGIGGPGMTDQGLKYLTNMKKLDTLTISNGAFDRNKNAFGSGGSITDKGLSYLEGLKAMVFLEIYSDNTFSTAALQSLRNGLPNLFTLRINGSNGPPLMGRNAPTTTQPKRSAQTRPDRTADKAVKESQSGEVRIVHFPKDRSLGTVKLLDKNRKRQITTFFYWIDGHSWWSDWEYLGEAKGDVTVPASKLLGLEISPEGWRDLSPLSVLRPDDLYELRFWSHQPERAKAGNRCLKHIEHLTGLKVLDLTFTNITGKGMRSVRNLKSLEYLTLPDRITDDGLADVAELRSLKGLYIKKNMITSAGLRHLAKLSSLEELQLGGDRINDAALLHLAKLPSLQYLLLWDKNFTDIGMAYLKNAPSLRILHFGHLPQLTDAALVHLSQIPDIERLSLHWNRNITDAGIVHLQKLRSLKMLDIGNSQVTDEGLAHLAKIKSLEYLVLPAVRSTEKGFDHPITDKGLAHLVQLKRLRHLNVGIVGAGGPITDEGLRHISRLQMLEELSVGGRSISNSGMEHIAKLTNLKKLHLSAFTKVTNEGLAKLTSLKSLQELSIGDRGAQITISGLSCLNAIPSLVELSLGGIVQDYSGLEISGLTKLEKLTFSLKGKPMGRTIVRDPVRDEDLACLANLKRLKWFQIGYGLGCQISNTGMAHLAGLTNMERLSLCGPDLTDDGLRYLANMKKLNMLNIYGGKFTDKGLHHLEDIRSLESVTLAGENYFSPAALKRFRKKLPYLYHLQIDKESAGGYGAIAVRN